MIELLLAIIATVTGIDRAPNADLAALAQRRAVEIVQQFDHRYLSELNNGKWRGWGEVIGYNGGYDDPAAQIVEGWQGSLTHWGILTDRSYTRIGCGHVFAEGRHWFVCIVGLPGERQPDDPPLPQPEPPAPVSNLPNTSTATRELPLLGLLFVIVGTAVMLRHRLQCQDTGKPRTREIDHG